jgi:hypothetical protein
VSADGAVADDAGATRQAALDRLERFAARLERVSAEALRQVAAPSLDSDERVALRARADEIAASAGLDGLVDDARGRVRDYVMRVYSTSNFRPTWIGLNWGGSMGPVTDRLGAIAVVQDAATAAVIEPFAPLELLTDLGAPFERIAAGAPVTDGYEPPPIVDLRRVQGGPLVAVFALVSLGVTFVGLLIAGLWPVAAAIVVGVVVLVGLATRRQA